MSAAPASPHRGPDQVDHPAGEARAEALPHRRTYLPLVIAFLRQLLDLHLALVDEVERELAPKRRGSSPGRDDRDPSL